MEINSELIQENFFEHQQVLWKGCLKINVEILFLNYISYENKEGLVSDPKNINSTYKKKVGGNLKN